MQVVLVMFRGDGERRSFSIARDMTVIGRREDCDLRIPVGDVSRKHCRIMKDEDFVRVEDLGSSNGTHVNGERIQEALLKAGDWIQIGPVQFIVQIDGVPTEEELSRPAPPPEEDTATGDAVVSNDGVVEASLEEVPQAEDEVVLEEIEEVSADALEEVAASEEGVVDAAALEEVEDHAPAPPRPPASASPRRTGPPPLPVPPPVLQETQAIEAPVPPPAEADDDWNFVMEEEPQASESHIDINVDIDTPQEQPHGHA